ncbi:MAG: ABC transporter ATP-binding protein [Clostridia bacterium]
MIRIFKLLKTQKVSVFLMMFLLIVYSLANLLLPAIMSSIVNNGINGGNLDYVIKYSLLMLAIATVSVITCLLATKIAAKIIGFFTTELSNKIFKKTLSLNNTEFSKIGASALLTRSTEDVNMISDVLITILYVAATVPTLFIGGVILSLREDVALSMIMFMIVPILLIIVKIIGRKILPRWEVADKFIDDQNQIVRERMNGIRVIRAYNKEGFEHKRLVNSTNDMAENIIKANTITGILGPLAMLILNFITVLITYVGAIRLGINGTISAGSIIAVIQYVGLMLSAIVEVSFMMVFLPKIKVNCNRMNEVFDLPEPIEPEDDLTKEIKGNISLQDVSFCYDGADEPAISNINMEIKAGETVSFIGGTGSGKSTILNVLLKFNPITSGKILVEGIDLCNISNKRIRQNISVAMQKSVILKGSLEHNIKLGKPDATYDEMKSASQVAQLENYIESLPDKYNHLLEQNGTNISGGQKQRVAIARAVIKNAPIYVFDDSFSALDFLTESNLRRGLNDVLKGKTQIIITQRVATAMGAESIYVLDKGKIVGHGNHRSLLVNCPIYKEIYDSQIGGDLNE